MFDESHLAAASEEFRDDRIASATPTRSTGRRGPVPKRRYQEGTFRKENEHYYSFFYRDRITPDGATRSVKERFDHGSVEDVSELSARREHDRLRQEINRERGSVPTVPRGETFSDAAKVYMTSIAPHLSCSTVRQRQSHLHCHLLPRFSASGLMALDVRAVQQFATDLLPRCNRKTILNVLGTLFAVLDFARKCGMRCQDITLASIKLRAQKGETERPYIRAEDAAKILAMAREPYRTIFALAWASGLRAAEILGLRTTDLDFERGVIQPRMQADDRTRELRDLKTPNSKSPIAMTPEIEAVLKGYLKNHWRDNPKKLLFTNRNGRPCKRAYVVKFGLKPLLKRLGLPTEHVGFHAFRHGIGTALADRKVSPKTVQQILRHTDIKTTFRYYVHSDMDAQREALATVSIGTNVPIGTNSSN